MTADASHRQTSGSGLYTLLVFVSIILVLIVVILSAWLRLSGSGLGCAEWPSCYALIKTETGGAEALAAAHLVPPWATLTHRLVAIRARGAGAGDRGRGLAPARSSRGNPS